MKLPSVLDEYKSLRGIKFDDPAKKDTNKESPLKPHQQKQANGGMSRTNQLQARLKQGNKTDRNQNLQKPQVPNTKPIDLAQQTKLSRESQKIKKTILENERMK